jgi:hypothetical protein
MHVYKLSLPIVRRLLFLLLSRSLGPLSCLLALHVCTTVLTGAWYWPWEVVLCHAVATVDTRERDFSRPQHPLIGRNGIPRFGVLVTIHFDRFAFILFRHSVSSLLV